MLELVYWFEMRTYRKYKSYNVLTIDIKFLQQVQKDNAHSVPLNITQMSYFTIMRCYYTYPNCTSLTTKQCAIYLANLKVLYASSHIHDSVHSSFMQQIVVSIRYGFAIDTFNTYMVNNSSENVR